MNILVLTMALVIVVMAFAMGAMIREAARMLRIRSVDIINRYAVCMGALGGAAASALGLTFAMVFMDLLNVLPPSLSPRIDWTLAPLWLIIVELACVSSIGAIVGGRLAVRIIKKERSIRLEVDHCLRCHYDLHASISDASRQCPECGVEQPAEAQQKPTDSAQK